MYRTESERSSGGQDTERKLFCLGQTQPFTGKTVAQIERCVPLDYPVIYTNSKMLLLLSWPCVSEYVYVFMYVCMNIYEYIYIYIYEN